jgi:hypothetical protein
MRCDEARIQATSRKARRLVATAVHRYTETGDGCDYVRRSQVGNCFRSSQHEALISTRGEHCCLQVGLGAANSEQWNAAVK